MSTIIRAWRGSASAASQNAYVQHFRGHVLPELKTIDGFLGASLLRSRNEDSVEFLVLTKWASMDAIRSFAGADPQKAVVEPAAAAALDSFDGTVEHYEIVDEST